MAVPEKQFSLTAEIGQVEETILGVFHTILLHRTSGKFHFTTDHTYSVGTLGFLDILCDTVKFTYVKLASPELDKNILKQIRQFSDSLLETTRREGSASGEIWLEFYQKRKSRWLFVSDSVPWEVWSIRIDTFKATSDKALEQARTALGGKLVDVVFEIAELINAANRQVPQTPTQNELETVFDTAYSDVQPFVFRIRYATGNTSSAQGQSPGQIHVQNQNQNQNGSVGNTVKKLIQDTLLA